MFYRLFYNQNNTSDSPSWPFYRRKWQISVPFHIPEAWKRYPFQAEHRHYREYPPGFIVSFEQGQEWGGLLDGGVGVVRYFLQLWQIKYDTHWTTKTSFMIGHFDVVRLFSYYFF